MKMSFSIIISALIGITLGYLIAKINIFLTTNVELKRLENLTERYLYRSFIDWRNKFFK